MVVRTSQSGNPIMSDFYHTRPVSIPTLDGTACALSACLRKIQNTIDDHLSTIPHVQLEAPPPRDYFIFCSYQGEVLPRPLPYYPSLLITFGVDFATPSYKLISLSSSLPASLLLLLLLIIASFTFLALIFV